VRHSLLGLAGISVQHHKGLGGPIVNDSQTASTAPLRVAMGGWARAWPRERFPYRAKDRHDIEIVGSQSQNARSLTATPQVRHR